MKTNKDKNKLRLLGKLIDAEIEASDNPDMKLVRECAKEIENAEGKITDAELDARLESIIGAKSIASPAPSRNRFKKRKLWVTVAAAALLVAMISAVAASPALWSFLTFPFTRNSLRLTEVPEEYVGIYTAEDLDLIRDNPDGSFILMADIDLGGASHTPIGDHHAPFDGKFNGNGHVISNFTITASGAAKWETVSGDDELRARFEAEKKKLYGGEYSHDLYNLPAYSIFGIDGKFEGLFSDKVYETYDLTFISAIGFFGNAGNATITGLGVENATVTATDADYAAVGVIAGQVGYISSCYVKGSTVTVNANTSAVEEFYASYPEANDVFDYMDGDFARGKEIIYSVSAGLLCGEAFAIDSCYTDGKISVSARGSDAIDYSTFSAGTIAGYAGSAVSSYTTATLKDEGGLFSTGIIGKACLTPAIMPTDVLTELVNEHMEDGKLDFNNANDRHKMHFETIKILSYFNGPFTKEDLKEYKFLILSDLEEVFFIDGDGTKEAEGFWLCYQMASRYEKMIMQKAVEDLCDISEVKDMYREAGMRVGTVCCYTPEGEKDAKYFEGFDFSNVWEIKNGVPVLRIFE